MITVCSAAVGVTLKLSSLILLGTRLAGAAGFARRRFSRAAQD